MSNDVMMQAALEYAKQGFAVFPLAPHDKYPICAGGCKSATVDPKQIGQWWRANPDANIGLAMGEKSGGLFAIDLDVDENKGIDGFDSLRNWQRANKELPETANTITGRGGYHLLYKSTMPVKNRVALLPGVDVRGEGGYIVVPPSIHPNGNQYQWEQTIEDFGIAETNEVINRLLATGTSADYTTPTFSIPSTIGKGQRNDVLYRMACSMQAKGASDNAILAAIEAENSARCIPPLEDDEVQRIVDSALKWNKGTNDNTTITFVGNASLSAAEVNNMLIKQKTAKKDANGQPVYINKKCIENIVTVLNNDETLAGKIRFDLIAYSVKYFGQLPWHKPGDTIGEWADFDDANLRRYLETKYALTGAAIYEDAVQIVSINNAFNPIVDYLEALPAWDGKEHIKHLLPDYLGAEESAYNTEALTLFMLGALSRVYSPGCKFDYMLVLVGNQGIGKSAFLRALAINGIWFDDNLNTVEGKEAVERLRGKWILELAELLAVKKQRDVETIKAFITTQSDSYREPYARRTTDRKRSCVFAATTNNYNFLTDRTGNRRFLPVEVDERKIAKDLFTDADAVAHDFQLAWAEALHYFKKANKQPKLVLSEEGQKAALMQQMNFLEEDPTVGIIQEYLNNTPKQTICAMDLWLDALNEDGRPKRHESNRLHAIMRNEVTGWVAIGNKRTSSYGVQKCYQREKEPLQWVAVDDNGF